MTSDISFLRFPLSALLALAFMLGTYLLDKTYPDSGLHRFLSGWKCMVGLSCIAAIVIAVEGTWKFFLFRNPLFWLLVFILLISLGLTVLASFKEKRPLSYRLTHLGFYLLVMGAFWGAPDFQSGIIQLRKGEESYIALTAQNRMLPLPFKMTLKEFRTDYYDDEVSPKQYTSRFEIDGKEHETSVNSPCLYKGWFIYQHGFEKGNSDVTTLEAVRDPWLPVIFLGMFLLAGGAFLSFGTIWKSKAMLPTVLVLAVAFSLLSVARIHFKTLVPALRSLWFVPHLIVYMIAYSALAISLVTGILSLAFRKKKEPLEKISCRLLGTASSLLIIGMLCGAVWAKYAWGDYWTWDAKECWAGATWLLTLCGTHFFGKSDRRMKAVILAILISFLAMQVTWYGVNHLPAANYSLHTYK